MASMHGSEHAPMGCAKGMMRVRSCLAAGECARVHLVRTSSKRQEPKSAAGSPGDLAETGKRLRANCRSWKRLWRVCVNRHLVSPRRGNWQCVRRPRIKMRPRAASASLSVKCSPALLPAGRTSPYRHRQKRHQVPELPGRRSQVELMTRVV